VSRLNLIPAQEAPLAPEWVTTEWMNHKGTLRLADLRGRVVALHAFQMLCPGCVSHGIPQAQRIATTFPDVAVIGLHTVFEHHAAMTPVSLAAFLHEYRIGFPVGVDAPGPMAGVPTTMASYQMRGTPTLVLIDHRGRVRLHAFGRPDDMAVGAAVATLVEAAHAPAAAQPAAEGGCSPDGCLA
jgi:hypothetical protein